MSDKNVQANQPVTDGANLFDAWLSVSEFERRFWQVVDIVKKGQGWFGVQHPPRSHDKLDNEYLPLLILAKHENGRRKNWDMTLTIKAKVGAELNGPPFFDAEYMFSPNQPKLFGQQCRYGRIEVVRGLTEAQSFAFKEENRRLASGLSVMSAAHDYDHGVSDMKSAVLMSIRKKAAKMENDHYSADTALVVWLRDEKNHHFEELALADAEFRSRIKDASGPFLNVCILGVSAGCHWVKGEGL